jgi:mannose-1-phosphate guanylyltransferase
MNNNYCVIMAGGIGSRFWPMSTPEKPKQFLDVLGIGKSLLQLTFDRLTKIAPADQVYILTNAGYADMVAEQLPQLRRDQILCEPMRKNTAPCIAYAAAKIHSLNPNARMIVAPSDHLIVNESAFSETIETALEGAEKGQLVTLGIQPTRPDTGYGYIEFDNSSSLLPGHITKVKQFREKPNLDLAKSFVDSGNFYWNSGIFIWTTASILSSLKEHSNSLYALFCEDLSPYNTKEEQIAVNHHFSICEDISIDFAIMENAKNVDVVLATFDWSDLGTWGSLFDHLKTDNEGNAVVGDKIKMVESKDNLVHLSPGKEAIIQGVSDSIIVESGNKLLILKREDEQNLKEYMKLL